MKKVKIIGSLLFCGLLAFVTTFFGVVISNNNSAQTALTSINESFVIEKDIKPIHKELFEVFETESIEYLYNYDDSPDYIYVAFEDYGVPRISS